MFKSFERKKPEIDPISKEILDRMNEIRDLEEEIAKLNEIIEKRGFQRDLKNPADDALLNQKRKKIIDAAEQIMEISEANGLDPKRFISQENIQAVMEKRCSKELEFRKAA
jgi:hypothetical protein